MLVSCIVLKVLSMFRVKLLSSIVFVLLLPGCTGVNSALDIGSHERPVLSSQEEKRADINLLASLDARQKPDRLPAPVPGHAYRLAELIDIAQQRNPATRQSWLQMRKAGSEAKIVKSALLPMIAATAVAGKQRFSNSIDLPIVGTLPVTHSAKGTAGIITVNWLLFDFGENAARQRVAANLQRVSAFAFNRLHQQLVFDVVFAFHAHHAGLEKQKYARQAITRANRLVYAARRRLEEGVGTNVEVAQARQLLAQTKLTARIATGEANSSAVSLASALAVPPSTKILLRSGSANLPRIGNHKMEAMIEAAFSSRPDVLASLSQVRAAQNNIDAVSASYLPKIVLGAYLARGDARLNLNGFSVNNIGPTRGSGVLVGITVPIYDGSLRRHRMDIVRDQLAVARSGVGVAKSIASREIATAYQGLRTALAVNYAARELVRAARITADAAKKAYAGGIGTISDASLATLGLYTSKEALVDSRRAAYHAAATLALATGN